MLKYIGLSKEDWEPKLAMAPRIVITPKTQSCISSLKQLSRIKINGSSIEVTFTASDEVRLSLSLYNQISIEVSDGNQIIDPNLIGIENINLQDGARAYAYHIPQGVLMHYNPNKLNQTRKIEEWATVSALDFAPSLLSRFGLESPSYMVKENLFSLG